MPKMKYTLYIDDNFHFMDENERYEWGEFKSLEEAIARAMHIVDAFLEHVQEGNDVGRTL